MSRQGLTPEEIEANLFDNSSNDSDSIADRESDHDDSHVGSDHDADEFGDSSEDDEHGVIYMQTDNLQVFQELPDIGVQEVPDIGVPIPTTPSTSTSRAPNPVHLFSDDLGAGPSAQVSSIIPVHQSSSADDVALPPGGFYGRGRRRRAPATVSSSESDNPDSPAAVHDSDYDMDAHVTSPQSGASDDNYSPPAPPAPARAPRARGRPPGRRGPGRPRGRARGVSQAAPRGGAPRVHGVPQAPPRGGGLPPQRRADPATFERAQVPVRVNYRQRDLSPSEFISYKRQRGEQCFVGEPIIKFLNKLPPTAPNPPPVVVPGAPIVRQPPRDPLQPVVVGEPAFTWQREKRPDTPSIRRTDIPPGAPSIEVRADLDDILELFFKFMPRSQFDSITIFTNSKIAELRASIGPRNRNSSTFEDTNPMELQAYVACLIFSGDRKDNHLRVQDLFDSNFGLTFYSSLFTKKRFEFLNRCIRFDDQQQRDNSTDKFIHIRELWETVLQNCNKNYIPGPILTVDEQLQAFRGRCAFKMYLPDKPAKYGIKVFMVCDAQSHYCINAFPYLGAGGHTDIPAGMLQGTHFTLKLLEPIQSVGGRVVCLDSWFTSMALVQHLKEKSLGIVGTVRPKPNMPLNAVKWLNIPIGESVALFNHEMGVNVIYTRRKPKKYVTIMTTEHNGFSYVEKKKTEAHMFYNASKGGVDTFDQMCAATQTARKTNRWPQCVFYHLINLIMNNAFILYSSVSESRQKKDSRHKFNSELAHKLAEPFARWRLDVRGPNLQGQEYIRVALQQIFKITRTQQPVQQAVQPVQPAQLQAQQLPAVFQRPQVRVVSHPVTNQRISDPAYPGFIGRKKTNIRKRCLFGKRTEDNFSGLLLCSVCNCAVCNNHSALVCPNCYPY